MYTQSLKEKELDNAELKVQRTDLFEECRRLRAEKTKLLLKIEGMFV